MAGLFGDLPQAKTSNSENTTSAWAAPKLQPQPKRTSILAPPPSVLRAQAGRGGGRTPGGAGRGGGRGQPHVKDESGVDPNNTGSIFVSVQDEYDPMKPNDFEEVLKERERIKREAEVESERQARLREMEAAMERLKQQQQQHDQGAVPPPPALDTTARAAALNVTGQEAYARRGQLGVGLGSSLPGPPPLDTPGLGGETAGLGSAGLGLGAGLGAANNAPAQGPPAGDKGMTLAQKMLMKMGWKAGEGLGRERQGISTPLVMQKTNARAGVIVNAEPVLPALPGGGPPDKKQRTGVQIVGTPSRVLCLRNMVGPGEVDPELEEEVGQECTTKYGPVTSVVIFEVTQPGYAPEEAVRIFVQFDRTEIAMKALVDLSGRFFGGREVRAAFFSEERFAKTDLAPLVGEFDV